MYKGLLLMESKRHVFCNHGPLVSGYSADFFAFIVVLVSSLSFCQGVKIPVRRSYEWQQVIECFCVL